MTSLCLHCHQAFDVSSDDLAFYEKVSPEFAGKKQLIPPPTLCPECRQQRRLSFRNERNLYHRKCDATGKQIVTMYSPDKPYVVYDKSEWWSDRWDPMSYGMMPDLSQSFFSQFDALLHKVPRPSLFQKNVENSDYTNHVEGIKNCYLCVDTARSEHIMFSKWIIDCHKLVDSYQLEKCRLCYESQYSVGNERCIYVFLSDQNADSSFLYNCKGCSNCFLCSNLRHASYCFENVQYSQADYEKLVATVNLGSYAGYSQCLERYKAIVSGTTIHQGSHLIYCEDSSGDFLTRCKSVKDSFDVIDSQDCRYCYDAGFLRDCYDVYEPAFDCELQYESYACNHGKNLCAAMISYDVDDVYYSDICHNSKNLFGCVGLRHKQYCILNKQYTKEEYELLVPKIIERMRVDGEWGEFFPTAMSPFGYNETVAQDFFPLTREHVSVNNWKWHEEDAPQDQYLGPKTDIADDISDVPDDIVRQILQCEVTGKPFKIIPQELAFYREMNIPIPRKCPDQRHKERMALRNPRKLWNRVCAKCQKPIRTSYAPERPEVVYCEQCYLQTVY